MIFYKKETEKKIELVTRPGGGGLNERRSSCAASSTEAIRLFDY